MKRKEEDDDGEPKSSSESTNQLVVTLAHVELEWLTDCFGFQLKQVGKRRAQGVLLSYELLYASSSFRTNLVVFVILMYNF